MVLTRTWCELLNKSFETPLALHNAGVDISIITDSPVIPQEALSMCAGLAINAGLDEETAWRAITINPAVANEISDRVGSLEVGKDGDVVIWDRNPLYSIGNSAYMTVIEGKIVYKA